MAGILAVPAPTVARADHLPAKVTYVDHVQPIFRSHCFMCHGPDMQKNDLALNSYASAMKGGASGEALIAGDPDSSYLWSLVNHESEPHMPPNADKLPDAELALIKAWIVGGLLEKGDSVARKSNKPAVAAFTPTQGNRPEGEPAMPEGLLREPVLHASHQGAATAIATSPWAPLAAVGTTFQVSLYHTATGELLGVLPFVEGSPYVLRFSRDGGLLLAAGGRSAALGVAALFDVKSGKRLATVGDELDAALAADLSPDHSLVALGGPRKTVHVYRVADGSLAYEITKHTDWVTAIEFSPDGKFLATGDRGGGLWLWDAATGRERGELRGHAEQVTSLSWRDDSAVIASASEDDTVRVWQPDGVQIKSWGAHGGGVLCVQFSHDGQIVSSGRDAHVKTWKTDGAAVKDVARMDDAALAARFTTDGARIVAGDWAGNVRVYEAATGNVAATLDPNPPTIAERLASLETEAGAARATAVSARNDLAAAESQFAAAESAFNAAKEQREAKRQRQADSDAQLAAVEQRRSAVAKEREALDAAAAQLVEKLSSADTELATAEAAAADAGKARDQAGDEKTKQAAVVEEIAGQIAKLEESLKSARALLASMAKALGDREQAATDAAAHVDELQANREQLKRRQAELEEIRKLRSQYPDGQ